MLFTALDYQDSPDPSQVSSGTTKPDAASESVDVNCNQSNSRMKSCDIPQEASIPGHRDSGCYASIETLPAGVEVGGKIPVVDVSSEKEKVKFEPVVTECQHGECESLYAEVPCMFSTGSAINQQGQNLPQSSIPVANGYPKFSSFNGSGSSLHATKVQTPKQDSCSQTIRPPSSGTPTRMSSESPTRSQSPRPVKGRNGSPSISKSGVKDSRVNWIVGNEMDSSDGSNSDASDASPKRRHKPISARNTLSTSLPASPLRGQSPLSSPHRTTPLGSPFFGQSPMNSPQRLSPSPSSWSSHGSPLGSPQRIGMNRGPPPPVPKRSKPQVPERTSSLVQPSPTHSTRDTGPLQNGVLTSPLTVNRRKAATLGRLSRPMPSSQSTGQERRLSAPGNRTFEDILFSSSALYDYHVRSGSPQRSRLPLAQCFPGSFTEPKIGTRHDSLVAKRNPRPISLSLEAMVVAKLEDERIQLTEPPYTDRVSIKVISFKHFMVR